MDFSVVGDSTLCYRDLNTMDFIRQFLSFPALVLLACSPLFAQKPEEGKPDAETSALIAHFRSLGIDDVTSKTLAQASLEASEEDLTPLLTFIDSDQPAVSLSAAIMAVAIAPETAVPRVRAAIESTKKSDSFLPIALALDPSVSNVNYLLARLGRDGGKSDSSVMCALMVLTRETHTKPELWVSWWEKNRESFVPDLNVDEEELQQRIQTAVSLYRIETVSRILRNVDHSEPLLSNLSGMFDRMREAIEDGSRLRLSPEAIEADKLLASGSLEMAVQAYAEAASIDPRDSRSTFLQACLLLDLGKHDEAAAVFQSVAKTHPEITSAAFLAKLSQRRGSAAASDWVADALIELAAMDHIPETELFGWPDPLIESIVGQAMSGGGPFATDRKRLRALVDVYPADAQIALGTALIGLPQERRHLLSVAAERFPNNPAIASARAQQVSASEKNLEEVKELTAEWMRVAPLNVLPALRAIELENWLPSNRFADEATIQPLPPDTLEAIAQALELPEFNDGRRETVSAISHTLQTIQAPFSLAVLNSPFSLEVNFQVLAFRILLTAKHLFASGKIDAGEQAARLGIAMGQRRMDKADTLISYVLGAGQMMFTVKALRDAMETAGRSEVVAELDALKEKQREKNRRFKRTEFASLVTLPVPSLQRALILRMALDEIRLLDEWIALKPEK